MKYIECPEIYKENNPSLFLAGGISGCQIWQSDLVRMLEDTDIVLLNPRRKHFPTDDTKINEKQINWEFEHLRKASAVSFWFPNETQCPITLYELGAWSMSSKKMFIGIDPKYSRKEDVEIQTYLIRPEIKIVYSLPDLAEQIKLWAMSN